MKKKKKNESHDEGGSYMVRRNLHSIHKFASTLLEMIEEHDEIESWMEHKISVAASAMNDVTNAFVYDKEENHDDDDGDEQDMHPHLKIAILKRSDQNQDDFGLNRMMGGCGSSNENRGFLGSGTVNENRQVIAANLKKKIIVETAEAIGNLMRITTKSGRNYEYVPYLGTKVELLRCEQYKIKIKINEEEITADPKDVLTIQQDKMGSLHIWKGEQQIVQHDKYLYSTKAGRKPDFYVQQENDVNDILSHISSPSDKDHVEQGYKLITDEVPVNMLGHE